jgi:hypothetical protein
MENLQRILIGYTVRKSTRNMAQAAQCYNVSKNICVDLFTKFVSLEIGNNIFEKNLLMGLMFTGPCIIVTTKE